jgi:hypothetical protein
MKIGLRARCLGFIVLSLAMILVLKVDSSGQRSKELGYESASQSSNQIAQIAFQCADENANENICLINSDGTGLLVLTDDTDGDSRTGNFVPKINSSGRIVYQCQDEAFNRNICAINSDRTELVQLTNLVLSNGASFRPAINESGRVAYQCDINDAATRSDVCAIDGDGTDQRTLESGGGLDKDPDINNSDEIAFACGGEPFVVNICMINANGSVPIQLTFTSNAMGIEEATDPSINDAGDIAYQCIDEHGSANICFIGAGGGETTQLTDAIGTGLGTLGFFEPSINNSGLIAFTCSDAGFNSNICIINLDGPEMMQITSVKEPQSNHSPDIDNDGQIVFACNENPVRSNVCIINSDGTGFIQLTEATGNESYFNPSISN